VHETRLQPPSSIKEICRTLEAAGHEAWCVGGAVRDALLGIATLDWDIATSALPEQVQKLFRRTVPVGIKFGTVGVLDRAGVLHEVTTFRHDVETDGRHAVVRFGASLEEDLARRDFTINAIAVHAETLVVRDPFHGRRDLEARIVRCVGRPRSGCARTASARCGRSASPDGSASRSIRTPGQRSARARRTSGACRWSV
jgi:tRNA nucleotidyltransferase (CCA-adding enzyme)